MVLATREGHVPEVWLVDVDSGEMVPLPTPLDGDGAFDEALGRRGWVAANVEYQVGAFLDGGDLTAPVLLPQAWTIYPAASDDLLLVVRYFGRSGLPGEKQSVVVVGPDGTVHRSALLPWGVDDGKIAGEVEAGVVTWEGIGGWDGEVAALPVEMTGDPFTEPRPFAVLAGRVILFERVGFIEAVDVVTGHTRSLRIPPVERRWPSSSRFGLLARYNHDATWVKVSDALGSVVAGVDGDLRWLPIDPTNGPQRSTVWFGEELLIRDYGPTPVYYDPITDRITPATIAAVDYAPRVDVTGRFPWPDGL